jgi:PAS domain S-box-containing protein
MEIDDTGYIEANKDGRLTYCNSQYTRWTGLTVEEARGYGWMAAIHPDDRSRVVDEWANSVKDERPVDLWFRYKRGSLITPVHARSVIVRDKDEVLGFVALIVPDEHEEKVP